MDSVPSTEHEASAGPRHDHGLLSSVREVIIVALGILCAFGIDAWWNEVQESETTRQSLVALSVEFEANVDALRSAQAAHLGIAEDGRALLHLTGPGADPATISQAIGLIGALWAPARSRLGSGALSALIASGGLPRIDDPELRRMLASWPDEASSLLRVEEASFATVRDLMQPRIGTFVPQMEAERVAGFHNIPEQRDIFIAGVPSSSAFGVDYGGLLGDLQFENSVVQRITMSMVSANIIGSSTLPRSEAILSAINAELE
ncbi:MAG: hypothetical protein ACR2QM_18555 [Longimicrobiales bacterium]